MKESSVEVSETSPDVYPGYCGLYQCVPGSVLLGYSGVCDQVLTKYFEGPCVNSVVHTYSIFTRKIEYSYIYNVVKNKLDHLSRTLLKCHTNASCFYRDVCKVGYR